MRTTGLSNDSADITPATMVLATLYDMVNKTHDRHAW